MLLHLAERPDRIEALAAAASAALGREIPLRALADTLHELVADRLADVDEGTATLTRLGREQASLAHRPLPEKWLRDADRLLLALLDGGPGTSRQIIDRLSDPMSRHDCEATLTRLYRRGHVCAVPGSTPRVHRLTRPGAQLAERLAAAGGGY